jgi:hypothetical protein
MKSERIKNLNETIEIITNKVEEIKRAIKFNRLKEKEKLIYRNQLNKALNDLAKIKVLKKELESKGKNELDK